MKKEFASEGLTGLLYSDASEVRRALELEPGFHNVLGLETAFARQPREMDYLNPLSPFFWIKRLSTHIYMELIEQHLAQVPSKAAVLDAGCGIGRFTLALARRFKEVVAFDPSRSAIQCCLEHVRRSEHSNVELHWADLSWLDELDPGRFDAVLAMELLCYVADPMRELGRLARAAKPGGMIIMSVEGRPGALCLQNAPSPDDLVDLLAGKPHVAPGDSYVRYFDERSIEGLLKKAGLADVTVHGSHYIAEGPFWHWIDDSRLSKSSYFEGILRAEQACRDNRAVAPWARVFTAAASKPKA